MPISLPQTAPKTLGEAFKHIYTVQAPTIDDLKVMVLIEAAGLSLYAHSAGGTDHQGVRDLLNHNGREEMVHANRVADAIHVLTGEHFRPPEAAENPYLQNEMPPPAAITVESLTKLADTEFGGDVLYATWADSIGNADAAALLRQNGAEESDHGNRLLAAAALLAA
jgi:Mn-containing catalase